MKAYIEELSGKYYGTEITVDFEDGSETTFRIWNSNGNPSDRELATWGHTRRQWEENELVDNGWDGKSRIRSLDLLSDSHYEDQRTYELAKLIVDSINKGETV